MENLVFYIIKLIFKLIYFFIQFFYLKNSSIQLLGNLNSPTINHININLLLIFYFRTFGLDFLGETVKATGFP